MIVYADRDEDVATHGALEEVIERIGHEDPVSVLIRYGQLEAAIADALQPDADDWNKTIEELRFAAILLAMAASHRGCEFGYDFRKLLSLELPERIRVRPPEGFAYYAVYPEQYRAAAAKFVEEVRPKRCGVIGIRSIGSTLSAIVAEAVFSDECDVFTYTVRPRGHPYDRYVRLTPNALEAIQNAAPEYFLVVDEGPGISGSSFAAVCTMLETDAGAARDHIVLFPSWDAPAEALRSETARKQWPAYRKYTASFEETCLPKLEADSVVDISAGAWRRYLYASEDDYPAVQPQHERRKYVALQNSIQLLYKFAGLGEFGLRRFRRAQTLARHGFVPEPHDFKNGFMVRVFAKGAPLSPSDLDTPILSTMAAYLAFISETFPAARESGDLGEMVRVNIGESLGDAAVQHLDFGRLRAALNAGRSVAVDGRMLPHEWIVTADGLLKTDAVDHYDDHFFPGCRNIAWDVAGAIVEWRMPEEARTRFISEVADRTSESDLRDRLPSFEVAYLAYRIGYATMAIENLEYDPAEAARFRRALDHYVSTLRSRLQSL